MGCLDIGLWMSYLELMSFISIISGTAMVIFTSKETTLMSWFGDTPYYKILLGVFIVQHILFAFKFILSELIDDCPSWIVDESRNMQNRVAQV